ncbi:hypothetical protein, partial [Streptomyces sp. NPDC004976]
HCANTSYVRCVPPFNWSATCSLPDLIGAPLHGRPRSGVGEPRLVVSAPGTHQRLAYEAVLTGTSRKGRPSRLHMIVDAHSGAVPVT